LTLRELRDSVAGRTIEVAAACEVSLQTVRRWERAEVYPRPQHIRRLAEHFKKSIQEINDILRETQIRPDTNDD
jgi:transcriptional regulator with XRE-family HTH domain